jgi:hypothetical protein
MLAAVKTHKYAHEIHPVLAACYRMFDRLFPPSTTIGHKDLISLRRIGEGITINVGKKEAKFGQHTISNTHMYLVFVPRDRGEQVVIASVFCVTQAPKLLKQFLCGSIVYKEAFAIGYDQDAGIAALRESYSLHPHLTQLTRLVVQSSKKGKVTIRTNAEGVLCHDTQFFAPILLTDFAQQQ